MKLEVSFGLECGDIIDENKEYFWDTIDEKNNQLQMSQYESFINFNKPANRLYCMKHQEYSRIKCISIVVDEFDK